ncbi:MAG: VanW family protein [Armatimonadota bacterium]
MTAPTAKWAASGVALTCIGLAIAGGNLLRGSNCPHVLGAYSTTLEGRSPEQLANIRKAVRLLNFRQVLPGCEFSTCQALGPTTADRGWKKAHAIIGDAMEDAVAGGICQVSSTLYNAVLLSGMKIIERHAHSRPVQSVPAGRDATVAWGIADLKFKNTISIPVTIRSSVTGERLTIQVAAAAAGPRINLTTTQKRNGSRLVASLWKEQGGSRELISADEYRLPAR